ncbi:hypothetical protein [Streptomyces bluensis]|uniref:hypothetical protein n=1 Tax=Streptomyces bluensis TaxID=33897 RepID=UPI0036A24911
MCFRTTCRGAVMYYFTKWRDDGTDRTIHDLLRWQARGKAEPSLVVLDTQRNHLTDTAVSRPMVLRTRQWLSSPSDTF